MARSPISFEMTIDIRQPLRAIDRAIRASQEVGIDAIEPLVRPVLNAIEVRMPKGSGGMADGLVAKKVRGKKSGWVFVVENPRNAPGHTERGHVARAIMQDGGTIDKRTKRKSPGPKQRTTGGVKATKFMVKGKNAVAPPRVVKAVAEREMESFMRKAGFLVV